MPLSIDPLSRRRFLQGTSVLALTAPASSLLADSASSRQSWALLSDTHIAADPKETSRQGVTMAENLHQVVEQVLAEKDDLSGVIVDGDCAYIDGQPGDYETLREVMKPLETAGLPLHYTLGNHDNRDTFYQSYQDDAGSSPVASKHCTIIETPIADWILLDTLRFVNKVEGELGQEQLEWLSARLEENPGKPALLVGHHYPQVFRTDVIPSDEEIKISGLIDSEPFLAKLTRFPAANAYIYGHSHNWRIKSDESGIHHINLPPTAYVFDPKRPAGWVRANIGEKGLDLELRSLDPNHSQHGETHSLPWRS